MPCFLNESGAFLYLIKNGGILEDVFSVKGCVIMMVLTTIVCIFILLNLFFKVSEVSIPTPAGAVVMAMGILSIGIIQLFPHYHEVIGLIYACVLFIIYTLLFVLLLLNLKRGDFAKKHIIDPINSFGIGTWIAATSIVLLNMDNHLSQMKWDQIFLYSMAILLYVGYIVIVVRNYLFLFKNKSFANKINGVALLPSVATQSLVIAGFTLFPDLFNKGSISFILLIDLILYCLSIWLFIRAMRSQSFREQIKEWKSTNCIIHGALSITGLSLCITKISDGKSLFVLWIIVSLIFLIVESIEILRLIERLKAYGIKEGILQYQTSQWARNFTFGMYLSFTMHLPTGPLSSIRYYIIDVGKYVVIGFFLFEAILMVSCLLKVKIYKLR